MYVYTFLHRIQAAEDKKYAYGRRSGFLLTDTVGFIQKLPTHLVAAFR